MRSRLTSSLVLAPAFPAIVSAHENQRHLMGTISDLRPHALVVQTRNGPRFTIQITADTEFQIAERKATRDEIRPGDRGVIDVIGRPGAYKGTRVRFARDADPSKQGATSK